MLMVETTKVRDDFYAFQVVDEAKRAYYTGWGPTEYEARLSGHEAIVIYYRTEGKTFVKPIAPPTIGVEEVLEHLDNGSEVVVTIDGVDWALQR